MVARASEKSGPGQTGTRAVDELAGENVRVRRLVRRAMQQPERLAGAWLDLCSEDPAWAAEAGEAHSLLQRSVTPLCTALCQPDAAEAELRVVELVLDLRALALSESAVARVLAALQQALGRCAPQPEWAPALPVLGRFLQLTAREVFERQDAGSSVLESTVRPLSGALFATSGLVGSSPALRQLQHQVAAVASAPGPVLIVGASGTGKELVARAIHRLGPAAQRPWLAVNCAALPHELIESELFGHEKGAFTGSRGAAPGLMRAAADGTLFLDEVTEMPSGTQAKLLRALEQRSVRPVGGVQEWPVRARVISATNRDPLRAISEGSLRSDLYYRLCVHRIDLPPLAQRSEDLPLLLRHFLDLARTAGLPTPQGFSSRSVALLGNYGWPGNVRELRNVIEHCCAFAAGKWVEPEHLPPHVLHADTAASLVCGGIRPAAPDAGEQPLAPLHAVEREHIQRALRLAGGNKAQAARLLSVSRHQLYVRLERLGITDW